MNSPRIAIASHSCRCSYRLSNKSTRLFASSTSRVLRSSYKDTISNLKIGATTRVIFQGFTGRQATQNAQESLSYGTKIVGGVTPGKEGTHLGLPLFPTVRAAKEQLNPDATGIYVAAPYAAAAIEEALEAEIPLIVAVAEHIPLHDLLRIHSMLRSQSKSRLVGANCPGIISPIGRCRIGFQPLPCFSSGSVGIVAKSGTLSYETVASTTRAGVGQSLVIGMGGDVIAGTNFVDALKVFESDDSTRGIIIVGEIGGRAEEEAAAWIKSYRARSSDPKPIMALVAGVQAPLDRVMGHAGACITPLESDAKTKIQALRDAGVILTNHPAKFGETMKSLLTLQSTVQFCKKPSLSQRRIMHTFSPRPKIIERPYSLQGYVRNVHIQRNQASTLLQEYGILISKEETRQKGQSWVLAVTVDRSANCPCLIAGRVNDPKNPWAKTSKIPFNLGRFPLNQISFIINGLRIDARYNNSFRNMVIGLVRLFEEKEASVLELEFHQLGKSRLEVFKADLTFDDAAFKSATRQEDIQALRNTQDEIPEEVEAEKDGIVYIKLPGNGKIGTLVNGAGLAMNTLDAIHNHSGLCTNFLDTGGKATAATVAASFALILRDPRVKAIFVNIFGGLTRCDMIAEGIILAYRDLMIQLPVVVRLRGTNEGEGQRIIKESGLPLQAFDDFEEAAGKVISLADAAG